MQTDGVTIGELWDRRAARDPAHVYCRFEDRDWTVGELDERINRLANALLAQGLVKGDRVALMLPSHPDHIVAIFALAKAGLVRVPVNVHLKGASLDFVFDRFEPRAIIADRAYSEVLAPIVGRLPGLKVVWRGTDAPADFAAIIDAASPARPAVSVMADDIIAITPSSGTTGEPKGVLKTDRSLRAGPMGTLALTGARSGDVLLLWEPLHHGAGVAVLIAAVMEPLTLAMVEKFSASRFWDQVRRYDVTHIHYLGGVLPLLLKQPGSPLRWADLQEFCTLGNTPLSAHGTYKLQCTLPQRTGQHVIYNTWQRSDSTEAFYTCMDVRFQGGGTAPAPQWQDAGPVTARGDLPVGTTLALRVFNANGNDVERVEIAEFGPAQFRQFAAEHQMQKLLVSAVSDHVRSSYSVIWCLV